MVTFTKKQWVVQDLTTKKQVGVGKPRRGLFVQANKVTSNGLWHRRMGHPSSQILSKISTNIRLDGSGKNKEEFCYVCLHVKQTRIPFPVSNNKASNYFDLIHCDIWGAYRVKYFCGASYFLTILDDASRGLWTYLMQEKSEASQLMKNFCLMVNTQFGTKVKIIKSDNGREFTSGPMKQFYGEHGIIHETNCADTPQQNLRVERKHRHALNVARALRFQANLPLEFWGESALTAAYLINRTPSSVLNGRTPYEILCGAKPSYEHTKEFGCLCYVHSNQKPKDKFGDRSRRRIFIGIHTERKIGRFMT